MSITRIVLIFGLPVFDFVIAVLYSDAFRAKSCDETVCWPVLAIFANMAFSWTTIYFGLFALAIAAARLPSIILRLPLKLVLGLSVLVLLFQCFFAWSFVIMNGFLPSADIIEFLTQNALQIPLHLMQTAPVISVIVGIAALFFAFGFAWVIGIPARKVSLPLGATLIVIGALASGGASYATAPYAVAKLSAISFNKMLLARINPAFDSYQLDRSLEKTFTKSKPAPAVKKIAGAHPVIVILIESLRRDLIEMEPSPLPFLKSLSREGGVFFDKAYATASHSNYADVAFWYSRYPMRSLGLQKYYPNAPERGTSIFKLMKQHGYKTGYISSQNELWGDMINWLNVPGEVDCFFHSENFKGDTWLNKHDRRGMAKLIRKGIATAGKIEDSQTLEVARRWIDGLAGERRFFLGMNLQNTHFSYVIPPGAERRYQPSELNFRAVYYVWPAKHKTVVRNRYLNAVLNLDRQLAAFAKDLKAKGLWDEALVVILGDSGEAFHEHGFGNHSGAMFDEAMRTFTLIKPPKSSAMKRGTFQPAISHLDITATIPDILGIPVPDSFQGRSILQPGKRPPIFMHTNAIVKQNGVVQWPWKLMKTYYPFEWTELYNLADDPGEKTNRARHDLITAGKLSRQLDLWINRNLLYYSDPKYYRRYAPPK